MRGGLVAPLTALALLVGCVDLGQDFCAPRQAFWTDPEFALQMAGREEQFGFRHNIPHDPLDLFDREPIEGLPFNDTLVGIEDLVLTKVYLEVGSWPFGFALAPSGKAELSFVEGFHDFAEEEIAMAAAVFIAGVSDSSEEFRAVWVEDFLASKHAQQHSIRRAGAEGAYDRHTSLEYAAEVNTTLRLDALFSDLGLAQAPRPPADAGSLIVGRNGWLFVFEFPYWNSWSLDMAFTESLAFDATGNMAYRAERGWHGEPRFGSDDDYKRFVTGRFLYLGLPAPTFGQIEIVPPMCLDRREP